MSPSSPPSWLSISRLAEILFKTSILDGRNAGKLKKKRMSVLEGTRRRNLDVSLPRNLDNLSVVRVVGGGGGGGGGGESLIKDHKR